MGLKSKVAVIILLIIILLTTGLLAINHWNRITDDSEQQNSNAEFIGLPQNTETDSNTNLGQANTNSTPTPLPQSFKLKVPFLIQAPYGIWDPLHEDACEEASLLMYYYFFKQRLDVPASEYDQEIIRLIDYEANHGYGISITLSELSLLAKSQYPELGNPRIEKNVTIEKLQRELSSGRPIIIPAAGRLLENPNFKNGGPIYHMLVITGYDQQNFITNDPGTKNGYDYTYPKEIIMDAIHDWDPTDILLGEKAYLVFD